jgi:transcriptional regulator with XRE-family HTH domain
MDRAQLADLLRTRREALQPEDVGLPRGSRRRTGGLRREEVAALSDVSTDYYSRIEQQRGAIPSEQVLAAIASGLRMTVDERDRVFRLAGHAVPPRIVDSEHIGPGMMRILDRLGDTPAQVMNHLGETLEQTRPAIALLGDHSVYTGLARATAYRWFVDPASRVRYPEDEHHKNGLVITAHLRAAYTRDGAGSRAAAMVDVLLASSPEFAALWREHAVVGQRFEPKRILHPDLGLIDVQCQTLVDLDESQSLLVFTAVPGSKSFEKLQRLSRSVNEPVHPLPSSPRRTERQPRVPASRRGVVDARPRRR